MKKHKYLCGGTFATLVILLAAACSKQVDIVDSITISTITEQNFTCEGGFGSASLVVTGNPVIEATSSAPEWLRVSTAEPGKVLFNVFANEGDIERQASITVSAEGVKPVSFGVTQQAFSGIMVNTESVELTDLKPSVSIFVRCTSDYEVTFTQNPEGAFAMSKTESGVSFSAVRSQARTAYAGRAKITPSDTSIEPVYIDITLPKKSDYSYLLGTWKVSRNTDSSNDRSDFTFGELVPGESFSITIEREELKDLPFTAELTREGKVRIGVQGFAADQAADRYYTIHFNGPSVSSPNSTFIYATEGKYAWDAEPVFNEETGVVTLSFSDAGITENNIPKQLNIWWSKGRYFAFTTKITSFEDLVLTKQYK